jgi:glutamate dehydrogenase/leucine dehydrogenase
MAWIMDTYSMTKGYSCLGVVTGKPVSLGGSLGRNEATAKGCYFVTQEAARVQGIPIREATAAIQGYGNAGAILARFYQEAGMKVIAVSDTSGGLYDPKGLNISAVQIYKDRTGQLDGYPEAEPISNEKLLELECDVLAPSALENVITMENAGRIKARIIAEAANGPTTPGADEVLHKNGIFVLPDILANAGGVTVSYFEWVQDLQGFFWDEDNVNRQLQRIMTGSFQDVYETSRRYGVNMRVAAYILAIDRVASATTVRGLFP